MKTTRPKRPKTPPAVLDRVAAILLDAARRLEAKAPAHPIKRKAAAS